MKQNKRRLNFLLTGVLIFVYVNIFSLLFSGRTLNAVLNIQFINNLIEKLNELIFCSGSSEKATFLSSASILNISLIETIVVSALFNSFFICKKFKKLGTM